MRRVWIPSENGKHYEEAEYVCGDDKLSLAQPAEIATPADDPNAPTRLARSPAGLMINYRRVFAMT